MKAVKSSTSVNRSGIEPVGYRVLVKPDVLKETTPGGIVIPESLKEGHSMAQMTGRIVALGEFAWKEWPVRWAAVGDRVSFSKFGGIHMYGEDGELYRLLNDEQITAKVSDQLDLSEFKKREQFK